MVYPQGDGERHPLSPRLTPGAGLTVDASRPGPTESIHDAPSPSPHRWALRVGRVLAVASVWVGGCTHPCDALEQHVCEAEIDEARCELIQDPDRRELLTRATCEGILEAMDARR